VPGEYIIVVQDSNGCQNSDTLLISVGVNNAYEQKDVILFPNPVPEREPFFIVWNVNSGSQVRLFSPEGKRIPVSLIRIHENLYQIIPGKKLETGIYFLELSSREKRVMKKIRVL
jgi:hypothetical protein